MKPVPETATLLPCPVCGGPPALTGGSTKTCGRTTLSRGMVCRSRNVGFDRPPDADVSSVALWNKMVQP